MSIVEEMSKAIAALAGPRGWNDTREAAIARAARKAGIEYGPAKRLYYKEIPERALRYWLVEKVRQATLKAEGLERNERIAFDRRLEILDNEISPDARCPVADRRSGVDRRAGE